MVDNPKDSNRAAEPKSRKKWLLIILALVLVVGGGLAFLAIKYFKGSKASAASTSRQGQAQGAQKGQEAKGRKYKVKAVLNLEPFLVNLADQGDVRFVKATFHLGMGDVPVDALTKDTVFMATTRDAIISLLSSKTSDQILTPEGKQKLREEIRSRVNAVIPRGQVEEVFIVDFVVQL